MAAENPTNNTNTQLSTTTTIADPDTKTTNNISENLEENPEENVSKVIHPLLQQEFWEQCEVTEVFEKWFRIISLYDKELLEQWWKKRAEWQIVVKPLPSWLINVTLNPYYAYMDHYYHLDEITIEQFIDYIQYFAYIFKEENKDKIPHNEVIKVFSYDDYVPNI